MADTDQRTESHASEGRANAQAPSDLAQALEIIGPRWSLSIVAELAARPLRFSQIRLALPDLSANILGRRLEELAAHGVVERRRLPAPASCQVYALTDWGHMVEPAITALRQWTALTPSRGSAASPGDKSNAQQPHAVVEIAAA